LITARDPPFGACYDVRLSISSRARDRALWAGPADAGGARPM